jgi:hypothetical protein
MKFNTLNNRLAGKRSMIALEDIALPPLTSTGRRYFEIAVTPSLLQALVLP